MRKRPLILFQGSHKVKGRRKDSPEQLKIARSIAISLGETLVHSGFDLVLTGAQSLDEIFGTAAVGKCLELGLDPRERIRIYPYPYIESGTEFPKYCMVFEPLDRRWQEIRTFLAQEVDAAIGLVGGKGTSDSLQKVMLANKPVFPIAVAGGAAKIEWRKLKRANYFNKVEGDIDFLADQNLAPNDLAKAIANQCRELLLDIKAFSRRVFIIHGHDTGLKIELARFLERIDFEPIILHEQPDRGQALITKLHSTLSDVGFAFVLLTPDDIGYLASNPESQSYRARQNVIFEHGLLIGKLGSDRVCAILKGEIETPSDLSGVLYKHISANGHIQEIGLDIVKELKVVGYSVDANKL